MCGIAGYFNPGGLDGRRAPEILRRMTDAIAHRGPDDCGAWFDAESGIALGHRRLSILDLSPQGHQPMHSHCGRYVMVYNGEIYNFRELRRELEARGQWFRGHSDTEVLLAGITGWGVRRTLERANGMFAFALWDRRERVLTLARDRGGEKPLYYGWVGNTLLFGSELKALHVHPEFRPEVDRDALALYLRHNYVPAPYSIYRGIRKLPPGTMLAIPAGPARTESAPEAFWSARDIAEQGVRNPYGGGDAEAVAELDALLRDAVRLRMEADVPLGAFLSGGIDSSTVVALMQAESARPVRTFTIGFHEAGFNEADFAKAVARHLGTDHTELYVTPQEARDIIPLLPSLYDEPFSDSSQIPTFLVSKLARNHVTVSLSGDAGDELFGGYGRYRWSQGIWNQIGWVPAPVRRAAAGGLAALSPAGWNRILGPLHPLLSPRLRQKPIGARLHQIAEVLRVQHPEDIYLRFVSHWRECGEVVRKGREKPTPFTDPAQWADLSSFTERMMYLDFVTYLPDDILVKVDRASMGVSLEARVPFLDPRVIAFAWRLPLSLKIREGKGKWILREVLSRYIPREMIDRPKMGFGVPIDSWLRGPLRDWAESLLDEQRLREEGFFDPRPLRARWSEHLSGAYDRHYDLWDILMFQAWLERERETIPNSVSSQGRLEMLSSTH